MQRKRTASSKARKRKTRPARTSAAPRRVEHSLGVAQAAVATAEAPAMLPAPAQPKAHSLPNSFALALGLATTSVLALANYPTPFNGGSKRQATGQPPVVEISPLTPPPIAFVKALAEPAALQQDLPQAGPPTITSDVPIGQPRLKPGPERKIDLKAKRRRGTERADRIRTFNPPATAAMASAHALVAEARRYLGTNPTGRSDLWCGAFMDMVLKRAGYKGGGNLASAYANYGTRISGPQIGAIAVMRRKGGGHVGIVSGFDANGYPIIISGNYRRRVDEAVYPPGRIYAYVVP